MIYSVRGKLITTELNLAVVECGGVGYACRTTMNTISKLEPGSEVTLYTYLSVREDGVELFGFADLQELNCFKMIISVNSVGPKLGLSVLSTMTPQSFALSVAAGDVKALTTVPGIGKKVAERIVLELKDKIANGNTISNVKAGQLSAPVNQSNDVAQAISALMVLGYTNAEATKALSGLPSDMSTEELIKAGLKNLAKF